MRKKTAVMREPLEAMLATCTDGVRGQRDRALLLLAWSGGGRRRSEVVGLQVGDVRRLDADTWLYALGTTKPTLAGCAATNLYAGRLHEPWPPGWKLRQPNPDRCSVECIGAAR